MAFTIGDKVVRIADCGGGIERIDRCKVTDVRDEGVTIQIQSDRIGFLYTVPVEDLTGWQDAMITALEDIHGLVG